MHYELNRSTFVREGKILHFGFSNFDAALLRDVEKVSAAKPKHFCLISNQLHCRLLERVADEDILPEAKRIRLRRLAYFPLEIGAFSDRILDAWASCVWPDRTLRRLVFE